MRTTEDMKTVQISNEHYKRIAAFKPVIEVIMDEKYEMDDFVAGLLDNGINLLLEKLLRNVPPETLWQSLQELGAQYPAEVYGYIAETLSRGTEVNKAGQKKTIGFQVDR